MHIPECFMAHSAARFLHAQGSRAFFLGENMKIGDIGKLKVTITDYLLVEADTEIQASWHKVKDALDAIFNSNEIEEKRIKKCFIEMTDAAIRKDKKMLNFWADQMIYFLSSKASQEIRRKAYFDVLLYRFTTRNPLITPAYCTTLSNFQSKRIIWRRK